MAQMIFSANLVAYLPKLFMRAMRSPVATDLRRRQHDHRRRMTTTVPRSHLRLTSRTWSVPKRRSVRDYCTCIKQQDTVGIAIWQEYFGMPAKVLG